MTLRLLALFALLAVARPARGQDAETVPGHFYGGATLDFELDAAGDGTYGGELLLDGLRRLRLAQGDAGWVLTVERGTLRVGLSGALQGERAASSWSEPIDVPLRAWNGHLVGGRYDLRDPSRESERLSVWERVTLAHRHELMRSSHTLRSILKALEDSPDRLRRFVQRFPGPLVAARLVEVLAEEDSDTRRLAAHWVFDASRQRGYLDRVLRQLEAGGPCGTLRELIDQARPTRRPLVVAHRGNLVDYPENTMPALRSAAELGADGLEIDLCLTRDDRIVVWHDKSPGDLVTVARNLGLEGGVGYQPVLPGLLSSKRQPTHALTLEELRETHGYARRRFSPFGFSALPWVEIPTFDDVAAYLAETPQFGVVFLDIKLPTDDSELQHHFARLLRGILRRHGLGDRVVIMNNDTGTTAELKRVLGDEFPVTRDVEYPGGGCSAVTAALELGNSVASIGRPRIGASYESYLEVLRADRRRIDREGLGIRLFTWTLNDPLELREVIAVGVDGIVTDRPAQLVEILANYRFED